LGRRFGSGDGRGQPDENRVINFYRRWVPPEFAEAANSVAH
jgi:hypothetical protein